MDYFVDPNGDDAGLGTREKPFKTISRGLKGAESTVRLQPGDTLRLLPGTYYEWVDIHLLGDTSGQLIEIVADVDAGNQKDKTAIIDGSLSAFRVNPGGSWSKATTSDAHPEEWISTEPIPLFAHGSFVGSPYRRLISYGSLDDLRSDSNFRYRVGVTASDPTWNVRQGPWRVLSGTTELPYRVSWAYMGPGFFHDPVTKRLHCRLSQTRLQLAGIDDFPGGPSPNELPLALWLASSGPSNEDKLVRVRNSHRITFRGIEFRHGGRTTVGVEHSSNITFEFCTFKHETNGIRLGSANAIGIRHCYFDGGTPPWTFRSEIKDEFHYVREKGDPPRENTVAHSLKTVALVPGAGVDGLFVNNCEFRNGHDISIAGSNVVFHHNIIENMNDEGLILTRSNFVSGGLVHSNLFRGCMQAVSVWAETGSGTWRVYRNVIDMRQPIAGDRPRYPGDIAAWRYGKVLKSNSSAAELDFFHNTCILHSVDSISVGSGHTGFDLMKDVTLTGGRRLALNNIIVIALAVPTVLDGAQPLDVITREMTIAHVWRGENATTSRSDGNIYAYLRKNLEKERTDRDHLGFSTPRNIQPLRTFDTLAQAQAGGFDPLSQELAHNNIGQFGLFALFDFSWRKDDVLTTRAGSRADLAPESMAPLGELMLLLKDAFKLDAFPGELAADAPERHAVGCFAVGRGFKVGVGFTYHAERGDGQVSPV